MPTKHRNLSNDTLNHIPAIQVVIPTKIELFKINSRWKKKQLQKFTFFMPIREVKSNQAKFLNTIFLFYNISSRVCTSSTFEHEFQKKIKRCQNTVRFLNDFINHYLHKSNTPLVFEVKQRVKQLLIEILLIEM